jgi:hypothetical protein
MPSRRASSNSSARAGDQALWAPLRTDVGRTAPPAGVPAVTVPDERALRRLGNRDLDAVFRASPAGDVPHGLLPGTGLLFPGTPVCGLLARLLRLLVWQGKQTDADGRTLVNLIGPFGTRAIRAQLSADRSWVDGGECVLIDYSTTSVIARMVRDEIRLVSPQLYLGVFWLRRWRLGWFTLRQQ